MAQNRKIVVLDDDPTGTQTVHGIDVITTFDEQSILGGFKNCGGMFYILTNSRSLSAQKTEQLHRMLVRNIVSAARTCGDDFVILSRGDSTLRGHWPLETRVIREELEIAGQRISGEIICPFFPEGGRYTAGDVHYVEANGVRTPAGQTEFANDATFGYTSSNLKDWVEEKTDGGIRVGDVVSVSLEEERSDIPAIRGKLEGLDGGVMIVNAETYADLEHFNAALSAAMDDGARYVFRCAAALPRVMGNITPQPLLKGAECVGSSKNGGLVVVGSHVPRSTQQLNSLLTLENVLPVELDTDLVLQPERMAAECGRAAAECERAIRDGRTAVIYTKRVLLDPAGYTAEQKLSLSVGIGDALIDAVKRIGVEPSFIVAKGGITSSDVATKALETERALVLGQIAPGIPVWRLSEQSARPGMPYVIFPGNVGAEDTLKEVVAELMSAVK